jgi:CRP-like cAMP-binding protein
MAKEVKVLNVGDSFGERALENDEIRTATVYVKSRDCVTCSLVKHDY